MNFQGIPVLAIQTNSSCSNPFVSFGFRVLTSSKTLIPVEGAIVTSIDALKKSTRVFISGRFGVYP